MTEQVSLTQKPVRILEKMNRVGKTWKYLVKEEDADLDLVFQTKIEPKDWPINLVVGESYLIPVRKSRGRVWNIEDDYLELVSHMGAVIESEIPKEEQASLVDLIPKPKTMTKEEIELIEKHDIGPATNDKPITKASNLDGSTFVRGSQLVVSDISHSNLPSEQEVTDYYERYKFVKKAIIDKSDIQSIGNRSFLKKSGFRKFIQAFQLTLEILDTVYSFQDNQHEYKVTVRCTAPNGQFVDAIAICQQFEKNGNRSKHDTLATAITRAKNRAISDLVAFGEVSAEEVN